MVERGVVSNHPPRKVGCPRRRDYRTIGEGIDYCCGVIAVTWRGKWRLELCLRRRRCCEAALLRRSVGDGVKEGVRSQHPIN
jgi:hypothetical protein